MVDTDAYTENQDGVSMRPITRYEAGSGPPIADSDIVGRRTKPVHLVDIKENPGVAGSILVEATGPDGIIESATFTGPRAADRAFAYVDAVDYYERRKPREYPKHVRRGGVDHLALDAEHEKALGEPTDEDKQADEAATQARDDVHGRHVLSDEARARVAAAPEVEPRPVRFAAGESDAEYAARLAAWQAKRRAVEIAEHEANPPPTAAPELVGTADWPTASASSIDAARLRDIAARRRAPDIENASED